MQDMLRNNTFFITVLLLILFFFMARYSIFFSALGMSELSSYCLYPFLKIQYLCMNYVQQWSEKQKHYHELFHAHTQLQKKYDSLLEEAIALRASQRYAEETKDLRAFRKRYTYEHQKVQVLARHFSSQHQFFLVNAGINQGIKKDMVALYGNCLIGKITDVYPWYSKVSLITDAECKVAVLCTQTGSSGIHEGINNEHNTVVHYVSHLETIVEGDTIISSGEGLVFPYGFGLGTIETAIRGDLFYTIDVTPFLDFHTIGYCILASKDAIEHGES
jgi:rod shape-determining protein MreC